jgi:hypothetical protein
MRDRWQVKTPEECSVIFVCVYRFAESENNSTIASRNRLKTKPCSILCPRIKIVDYHCHHVIDAEFQLLLLEVTHETSAIPWISLERPIASLSPAIRSSTSPAKRPLAAAFRSSKFRFANTAAPALTEKLTALHRRGLCPLSWLNESRRRDSSEKPFDFAAGALRFDFHRFARGRRRADQALQIGFKLFADGSLDRALAPERSGALTSTARAKIAVAVAMRRGLKPSNILPDGARLPVIADLGSGRGLGAGMAQRVRTMSDVAPASIPCDCVPHPAHARSPKGR